MQPILPYVSKTIFKLQVELVRLVRRVQIHKLVVRRAGACSEFATELSEIERLVGRCVVFCTVEAGLVRLECHLSDPMLHYTSASVDAYLTSGSRLVFYSYRLVE